MTENWKPKKGGKYYWISSSTLVRNMHALIHKRIWADDEIDHSLHEKNNCFKSQKEAQFIYKCFGGKF
jgi:hypothetical protein